MIAAYRSQADAEAGFRQLKDPHVVSFSPMFHWTDSEDPRPRLLLRPRPDHRPPDAPPGPQGGLDLSVRELLHTLAGIEETVMIYPSAGGQPNARRMLTDRDPAQQQLFEIFNLSARAPRA